MLFFFLRLAQTVKVNADLNFEKNEKLGLINSYFEKEAFPPSELLLKYYQDKKEKISDYYKSFYSVFVSRWSKMPRSAPEPLKFKEKLFKAQSKIKQEARGKKIKIGEGALYFGFNRYETEIPVKDDIPDLVVELQAIEELTSLMMRSKILALESVKLPGPENIILGEERQPFVRIFPVRLTIKSNFDDFMKFLNLCGNSEFIFVIGDMHIYQNRETDERTIKADILINTVIFL